MRSLLLLAAALLLAAPPVEAQVPTSLSAERLYKAASPAVFLIEVRDASGAPFAFGSAFMIPDGRLVTNAHVVEGGSAFLKTGAVALPLTLEKTDALRDLAVLRSTTPLDVRPLDLAPGVPEIGAQIFVIGNPRGLERSLSEGLISGRREHDGVELVQITAPISSGSSGGPVLDGEGRVVAVTVSTLRDAQNLNFAVPVGDLLSFLSDGTRSGFNDALVRLRTHLAARQSGDAWAAWNEQADRLIGAAAAEAVTADEYLALAAAASDLLRTQDRLEFADRALRLGTTDPDSARVLALDARSTQIVFDADLPLDSIRDIAELADRVVAARPASHQAFLYRAQILARIPERKADALASARRAVELARAQDVATVYTLAVAHGVAADAGAARDDDAAFAELTAADSVRPYHWAAHAQHLDDRGEASRAAEAYETAYRMSDGEVPSYACSAGRLRWVNEEQDRALAGLRACVEGYALAPSVDTADVAYAHRGIASILVGRGVYSTAESHARQALRLQPEDAWAALALAQSLLGQERYTEAATAAEEAIRLSDGRYSTMHFAAGSAYFESQEWSRCAAAFQKADQLDPQDVAAAYNTALCMARQGYYRDAAQWMETVLRRAPNRADRRDIEDMIRKWRGG